MEESLPKARPLAYYRSVLVKGNGTEWRALLQQCREDYDIAFQVGRALSALDDERFKTVKLLWKHGIECHQPGINIRINSNDEEEKIMRKLNKKKYAD